MTAPRPSPGPEGDPRWALYPHLFAVFPVISLAAANVSSLARIWPSVLAWLVGLGAVPLVVVPLLGLLTRRPEQARWLFVLHWVVVFSYGHLFTLLGHRIVILGVDLGRHRYLFPAVVALAVAGSIWLSRRRSPEVERLVRALLTSVGGGVVVAAAATFTFNVVRLPRDRTASQAPVAEPAPAVRGDVGGAGRDVYFVLLDGYAGGTTLEEDFGFDNREFLAALRARGFELGGPSFANYAYTEDTMAALLAMRYLRPGDDVSALIGDAPLLRVARTLGYRTVWVGSWLDVTRRNPRADENVSTGFFSEFGLEMVKSTIVGPVVWRREVARRVLRGFDALPGIAADPGPTFTFAHIISPHSPYLFAADGRLNPFSAPIFFEWGSRFLYLDQLRFVNGRVIACVDGILAAGGGDPIIVLFSDHGPDYYRSVADFQKGSARDIRQTFTTFLAYRVPEGSTATWKNASSPVNLGRAWLSTAHDAEVPLLPNRSFWGVSVESGELTEVVRGAGGAARPEQKVSEPGAP